MSTAGKKDAAKQAYSLGHKAYQRHDFNRAIKYLRKSIAYNSTREAKTLLFKVEYLKKSQEQKKNNRRSRTSSRNFQQTTTEEKISSSVTDPEIKRVLREKDYYKLLGVERNFQDVKNLTKKYRKLAMKFHPDRNQLPGAEDAFKKIATAYECLKDPHKRAIYNSGGRVNGTQFDRMRTEDIIRMFFENGPGFFPTRPRPRHEDVPMHEPEPEPFMEQPMIKKLLSLLPLFIIVGFSLFPETSWRRPNDPFSLERTLEYSVARVHSRTDIPFYVNRQFRRQAHANPNFLQRVEDKVEGQYLRKLEMECKKESAARKNLIAKASEIRGEDMVKSLRAAHERIDTSCLIFNDYISQHQL